MEEPYPVYVYCYQWWWSWEWETKKVISCVWNRFQPHTWFQNHNDHWQVETSPPSLSGDIHEQHIRTLQNSHKSSLQWMKLLSKQNFFWIWKKLQTFSLSNIRNTLIPLKILLTISVWGQWLVFGESKNWPHNKYYYQLLTLERYI